MILSGILGAASKALKPTTVAVLDDVFSFTLPQQLRVACKMQLAQRIYDAAPGTRNGAVSTAALAAAAGADAVRLDRVLFALQSHGYFSLAGQDAAGSHLWSNTHISNLLRASHPNNPCDMVGHQTEDAQEGWQRLYEWTADGSYHAFKATHGGQDIWAHYEAHPAQSAQFNGAMRSVDNLAAIALAADYDWTRFSRVVNVGGSLGHFSMNLLRRAGMAPNASAVVFDLPHVVAKTREFLASPANADVSSRVKAVGGSFFEEGSVPPARDGDVYVMRLILHDWNDADCQRILAHVRAAMTVTSASKGKGKGKPAATLALVENVIDEPVDVVGTRYTMDLHMGVLLGAKERRRSEWQRMLEAAGFRMKGVTATRSLFSVIEAVPV